MMGGGVGWCFVGYLGGVGGVRGVKLVGGGGEMAFGVEGAGVLGRIRVFFFFFLVFPAAFWFYLVKTAY